MFCLYTLQLNLYEMEDVPYRCVSALSMTKKVQSYDSSYQLAWGLSTQAPPEDRYTSEK